jgi:two-component system cell cycle sensor histidine kinase/response regulator CckA
VECSEDAIVCIDLDGSVLSWNRGAAAIYGYPAEEMLGRPIASLAPPECAHDEQEILDKIRAGERVQQLDTVRIRKNSVPIDVSLTVSPIREGRQVVGAWHVARDISERKRLEAANAQLVAVIGSSEDAIISIDTAGRIKSWNDAAERTFGYSAAEMIGQSIDWLAPADRQKEEEAEFLAKIKNGERVDHFETVRRKNAAAPIHVSLTVVPIRDRQGSLLGASYIAREITERRRLEAANAQLAAIIQSSEDAIVSKDLTGVIQTWNAGAERVYGWAASEAIGHNIAFLLPPGRANEEQEILATLRRGERVEHFETTRLRKDGRLIDVSVGISPIRDASGRIIGASHVARDVTERKSFELQMQQAQRLESLGVLAGGIAHDFNNLLTGVIGNASLIGELLPAGDPLAPLVTDVTTAAERAAALTAQLLAYSGKGQFVIGPVDVDRLMGEISGLVKASVSKNVFLVLDLGHHAPPVEGDQTQLHQLLMNLVLNGAEAIGEERHGTVTVRTALQHFTEGDIRSYYAADGLVPGDYAVIEVRDDGCGMDDETKARIFDPFFSTKFLGRGLGLAAALGIVRAHKGTIRVRSKPGEGSTFTVLLPSVATVRRSRLGASKGAVLVVDDEEVVRKTAKVCIEKHGYHVLTASNGFEAIERFGESRSDIVLVLLDLTMPVMGGEETLRQLRDAGAGVPIVLSSGYTEADARKRFALDGLAGFVQKPYSSIELMDKLESVLRAQ